MDRDNAPGQGLGSGGAPKDLALGLAQPKTHGPGPGAGQGPGQGQPVQRSLFLNNPPPGDKERGDKDRPQLSPRNPYATPLVVLPRGSHQPPKQLSPFITAGGAAQGSGNDFLLTHPYDTTFRYTC